MGLMRAGIVPAKRAPLLRRAPIIQHLVPEVNPRPNAFVAVVACETATLGVRAPAVVFGGWVGDFGAAEGG